MNQPGTFGGDDVPHSNGQWSRCNLNVIMCKLKQPSMDIRKSWRQNIAEMIRVRKELLDIDAVCNGDARVAQS